MTRRTCDELGVCQGHSTPCSGCSSHKACPCPQACELPAPDAEPLHDEPATVEAEAREAAQNGTAMADACPYPFSSEAGVHFKAVYLLALPQDASQKHKRD